VRAPFKVLKLNDDYTINQSELTKIKNQKKTIGRIPSWFSTTNVAFNRKRFQSIDIDMAFDGHYGNEDVDLGRAASAVEPPFNRTTLGSAGFVWHVGKMYRARTDNVQVKKFSLDLTYTKDLLKGKWKCKKTCSLADDYRPKQWDYLLQKSVCPAPLTDTPGVQWSCSE
jgi:hypothetical protein